MGTAQSIDRIGDDRNVPDSRKVFSAFESYRVITSARLRAHVVYTIKLRYQRFAWFIHRRFNDFYTLDADLRSIDPDLMFSQPKPKKFSRLMTSHSDPAFCSQRGVYLGSYLQMIMDLFGERIMTTKVLQAFLEIGSVSFSPELGRKGREGILKKSSGGYHAKFSRSFGDYFKVWAKRYVVVKDCGITYYKNRGDVTPQGALHIDDGLRIWVAGRLIHIHTHTRVLIVMADTKVEALQWQRDLQDFYLSCSRRVAHRHISSYPPRNETPCRVFTCGRDYFGAVAVALLSAQHEILIASWMVSPYLWLTRPPEPPVRLDQILKFKAEQGVKIYVMLYQEVELASQGNDSMKCKAILEALHPQNIRVVRHPNKFMGGSTAILWSHHEKVVVIDRRYAFLGGIDLAFGRYDEPEHILTDEEGWRFPGSDYYQPGEDHFIPILKPVSARGRTGSVAMADYEAIAEATDAELALTPVDVEHATDNDGGGDPGTPNSTGQKSTSDGDDGVADPSALQSREAGVPRTLRLGGHELHPEAGDIDDAASDASEAGKPLQEEEIHSIRATIQATSQGQSKPAELPVATPVDATEAVSCAPVPYPTGQLDGKEKEKALQNEFSQSKMLNSFLKSISEFSETFTAPSKTPVSLAVQRRHGTARDMFPRMPWHDVHTFVGGAAARDVAAHYIQRWNHHKLAKNYTDINVMFEGTDNQNFGTCARCELPNISQFIVNCPKCGHNLGPRGAFIEPPKVPAVPQPVVSPFMLFECSFNPSIPLPVSIQGAGPCVVSGIVNNQNFRTVQEGVVIYDHVGGVPDSVLITKLCFDLPPPFVHDVYHPSNKAKAQEMKASSPKPAINIDSSLFPASVIPPSPSSSGEPVAPPLISHDQSHDAATFRTVPVNPNAPALPEAQPVAWQPQSSQPLMFSMHNNAHVVSVAPPPAPAIVAGTVLAVTPARPAVQNPPVVAVQPPSTASAPSTAPPAYETTKRDPLPDIGDPIGEYGPSKDMLDGMVWENPRADELRSRYSTSKLPAVGDILISVNGIPVNHLDSTQIARLLARIRFFKDAEYDNSPIKIVFKRHCTLDVDEIESYDTRTRDYIKFIDESCDVDGAMAEAAVAPPKQLQLVGELQRCVPPSMASFLKERAEAAAAKLAEQTSSPTAFNDMKSMFSSITGATSPISGRTSVKVADNSTAYGEYAETTTSSEATVPAETTSGSASPPAPEKPSVIITFIRRRDFERKSLICREALSRETRHRMFEISKHRDFFVNRDVLGGLSQSCQVQVLRSVGMWSVGHRPEKSIYEAWLENISKAQRFIYIENQFFLSDLAGSGVQNRIVATILEKLIAAAKSGRAFRVIVVLPLHPEGDFLNNSSVRYVMHYQYMTICRGPKSLLRQFQDAVPNVRVSDYLQFYSLRNWGVMRGEVVTDQIYVHDKLLIVDDRVMVVGSANLNDRSMLGERDTEMAVRIEDTYHVQSVVAGGPWVCGDLVRRTREALMRRHLGDPTADVTDPLRLQADDVLLNTAVRNSRIYAVLDGMKSFDTCNTLWQFAQGLNASASMGPLPPLNGGARASMTNSSAGLNVVEATASRSSFSSTSSRDTFTAPSSPTKASAVSAIPIPDPRPSSSVQSRGLYISDPDVEALTSSIQGQIVLFPLNFLNSEALGPSLSAKAVLPTELFM